MSSASPRIEPAGAADAGFSATEIERYSREREAHNKYFSEGTRKALDKYYATTRQTQAAYERVLVSRCRNGAALEYGCGTGSHSVFLARNGASRVVGIDLSDVAIAKARESARAAGVPHAEYFRMNAETLDFADSSFDLICGTAILHHLDLHRAFGELARVLRPGGTAAFLEPLGHNPAINLYRRLTPTLRTVDEHPLHMSDLELAQSYFSSLKPEYFGLQSLMATPFKGLRCFGAVLGALQAADAALFRVAPFMRRYAWQVVLVLEKPIKMQ
jgi:ubiquinone/menaquinone biosynthesis C-methylase UbiE